MIYIANSAYTGMHNNLFGYLYLKLGMQYALLLEMNFEYFKHTK